jgi:hypothetical protein
MTNGITFGDDGTEDDLNTKVKQNRRQWAALFDTRKEGNGGSKTRRSVNNS